MTSASSFVDRSNDRQSNVIDVNADDEHYRRWSQLCAQTSTLAAELGDSLRLILEPTKSSKLEYVTN